MTTTAITVENVAKHYRLGEGSGGGRNYGTLRESIMSGVGSAVGGFWNRLRQMGGAADTESDDRARGGRKTPPRDLWALRGVSFRVQPGEAVGIIGRNGAGKSTLLKVLSRITAPTEGSIELRGRVGSLLEVGTGFHPELTGRENIFLNGAIIGMSRREITRKYHQIVDFSEVADFIETPVKRYSSGMYVKLAFSVAAHMEPDILLIDEVLSVGDLAFQRKCMDYARKMLEKNVTLLFVSHNMFAVKAMCDRAVFLDKGSVAMDGTVDDVTRLYDQQSRLDVASWATGMVGSDPTKCPIFFTKIEQLDDTGQSRGVFEHGERMRVRLHYHANVPVRNPNFNISFLRSDNIACCNFNTAMDRFPTGYLPAGDGVIELVTPPLKLVSELYSLQALVWDEHFQRLYCAQQGGDVHVKHPLLSTEFGVFHEPAEWSWVDRASS